MLANLKITKYKKSKGKWEMVEQTIEENQIIDINHWYSWAKFDRNLGAYVKVENNGCGCLYRYTIISPDKTEKVEYQRTGAIHS